MPNHRMVDTINATFATASVRSLAADDELMRRLRTEGAFVEVARDLLGLDDDAVSYLDAIPPALQEAARAAVASAVADGKAIQVQYLPDYEFSVSFCDYGGAVSVQLRGPYPPEFPRDGHTPSAASSV